ncbi:DivIVA domain-containing protein [Kocuria sp. M1R5S2]|uniref:DivIVA domain-containing protein n=1 Tax=Kocuria rhizosphaerae TaxID=3376285 RepID=UPI0037936853
MALTPEDVINKRFQPTKFREGYDQDEVDDFLDEIVVELRRLNQENADLKQQLEAAGQPVAPRDSTPSPVSEAVLPAEEQAPAAEPAAEPVPEVSAEAVPEATAEPEPEVSAEAAPEAVPAGTTGAAQSAAGVLAMAQKLHDEYVAEGSAERERLISEARSQAEELISEARRTREETLATLHEEETQLETRVSRLRAFETDYRANLKGFIQEQLRELDTTPSVAPAEGVDRVDEKSAEPVEAAERA